MVSLTDLRKLDITDWALDSFLNVNMATSPQLNEELIELTTKKEKKSNYKTAAISKNFVKIIKFINTIRLDCIRICDFVFLTRLS